MDAHANAVLADEGNFVLHAIFNHLVQIFQERDLLFLEKIATGLRRVVVGPEGADVNARGFGHVNKGGQAPKERSVDSHQILGGQVVSLVQDDTDLGFTTLQLSEEHLQLQTNVQLGGVKHHEDQIGTVNEPLADIIERIAWTEERTLITCSRSGLWFWKSSPSTSLLLLPVLNDAWCVHEGHAFQQLVGHLDTYQLFQEVLTKLFQRRE